MLQEQITADLRKAMIEKDTAKRDLLRVILSEINKIDKMEKTKKVNGLVADEEVIIILKKGIESAKECHTEFEIPIYELYLPKSMSDQEMKDILTPFFNTMNKSNVGELMKLAKEKLGKDFDGKKVNSIIKEL
jgi:uncharacterized protein YqeY